MDRASELYQLAEDYIRNSEENTTIELMVGFTMAMESLRPSEIDWDKVIDDYTNRHGIIKMYRDVIYGHATGDEQRAYMLGLEECFKWFKHNIESNENWFKSKEIN